MFKNLLVVVGVLVAFSANAADMRVGYVDLQKALQSVDAGKRAKDKLEKAVAAKRAELEKRQKDLQKEAEAFEKKSAIMNEAARAKKQAELQRKLVEFQRGAQESQLSLQKEERDLTKPLIDELRKIIEVLGKEMKFSLILEKNEGAVLYAQTGSDLTDEVVSRFNKRRSK